ncbi:cell division protein YceG involved in septum cleavage [Cytobacillus horneckiae]
MMNKRNTRAFAFGVFFSAMIIGIVYLQSKDDSKETANDLVNARSLIEKEGYVILSEAEYNDRIETEAAAKEEKAKEEGHTDNNEPKMAKHALTIETGMLPSDLAKQLLEKNIIEDADKFASYLDEYGYSKKLQVGTFEVNNEMSFKEIAELISK